jgi:uncharacterized membrane protein YsdA (DUF1294 family)/cold shock CspA family protein
LGAEGLRHKGRITEWRDSQGFGFVTPSLGGERVFLHISAFARRARRPAQDDLVTYELTFDERRRPRASNVRFSTKVVADSESRQPSSIPLVAASGFIIVVAAVVFAGRLPFAILALYLGASAVAFAAYALDKSAARNGRRRTPESTLHLFGLVGGWPGALFAQRVFRHKSSKAEFQRVFWVTVAMNCLGLGWLLTERGSAFLAAL